MEYIKITTRIPKALKRKLFAEVNRGTEKSLQDLIIKKLSS